MPDIGINYLSKNEESYKVLKKYKCINTLKFPGRLCTFEELKKFLVFTKSNDFKIDFHGIPGMLPAFSCDNRRVIESIDFNQLKQIFLINNNIHRISTHMGINNKEKLTDYSKKQLIDNWKKNYITLKNKLENILNHKIEIGLENIPGEFCFDPKTLMPQYLSENWKMADFGVFDITHAKLSCKTLNMKYGDYLAQLKNTDKVKILHIAGNTNTTECLKYKVDKHTMLCTEEISDIIKSINKFRKIDLVDSEYVFKTKYSSLKETIIESVTIKKIIETKDEEKSKGIMRHLEKYLKDDISNVERILDNIV